MGESGDAMATVVEAAASIRSGDLGAVELTQTCLDVIDRRNEALNAFVHLDADLALAEARAVDDTVARGRIDELGPLAGVPFGVKDLEDCAGMPTTKGSRWYVGRGPAPTDSIHVARLRAAGAIPVGKTATPEFGTWAYTASPLLGVTRNPWDPTRTPGGSSGGSAAAVSSGMVPFCTASDGGGSIRTPASFTGLPGLKPTYGRVPTAGSTHLAQNAVIFSLASTVADTALLLDVLAGPDPRDRTALPPPGLRYVDAVDQCDLSGLRAAWSVDLGFAVVDPGVAALCEEAAHAFVDAVGAELVDRPLDLEDYIVLYSRIEGVDQFVGVDPDLWQHRLSELDPRVAPGWETTPSVTLPKLAAVEAARRRVVGQMADLFADVDLLITPMSARPPFAAEGPMPTEIDGVTGHGGMAVIHGMLANLVNLPAMSLPAGLTAEGLPVGLQVIGPRYREDLLLAAAARYERARPWPRLCPRPD